MAFPRATVCTVNAPEMDLEKGEDDAPNDDNPEESQVHRASSSPSYRTSASDGTSDTYNDVDCLSRTQTIQTRPSDGLERHPTALSRIATARSQHTATVGAIRTRSLKKPLPDFGAGKPYPPALPAREEYVVEFAGPFDSLHPQNWPTRKK